MNNKKSPKQSNFSESIVFFGSGPVAEASLRYANQHFKIEAVITKSSTEQIMKKAAPDARILITSDKIELSNLIKTSPFQSKLGLIVDFGIIVEKQVIEYFQKGIINSHFSLLPELRGADPITFSVLSGQKETGVSLMLINQELDEGLLIAQEKLPIKPKTTTPQLTKELIYLSNEMLGNYLPKYFNDEIKPFPQSDKIAPTYSRKLSKNDGKIDWSKSAEQIEREIRAFIDWPKSYTSLAGIDVIITEAEVRTVSGEVGELWRENKSFGYYCGQNSLEIKRLKPAGKNEMLASAFLAGYSRLFS